MFFAALVFAVGYLRLREPWPSAGTLAPPLLLPGLGVFLLACGSGLVHRAHGRVRAEPSAPGTTTGWLLAGVIVLGIAFLALQAFLASSFWQKGLRLPSGGSHASAFYGLMAVHAVHVAVGLLGLTRVAVGLARGTDVRQRLRLWNLYWHFVTMTGLLFFGAVYLP
jgi:cytochrome c oxidase subunit 3